jgi:hypothetical protein
VFGIPSICEPGFLPVSIDRIVVPDWLLLSVSLLWSPWGDPFGDDLVLSGFHKIPLIFYRAPANSSFVRSSSSDSEVDLANQTSRRKRPIYNLALFNVLLTYGLPLLDI